MEAETVIYSDQNCSVKQRANGEVLVVWTFALTAKEQKLILEQLNQQVPTKKRWKMDSASVAQTVFNILERQLLSTDSEKLRLKEAIKLS